MSATTLTAFVICLLILAPVPPGRAQSGDQGSIEGIVTDPSGAVVPGVALTARHLSTSKTFAASTNQEGLFRFPVLPVGTYELAAQHAGFTTLIEKNLVVTVGSVVNLELSLPLAGNSESVIVSGETPLLETTRSQVSTTVGQRFVENLPTNGRNFIDFALLTPGITRDHQYGVLSFAGQRPMDSLLVDGADDNNTHFGLSVGRTGIGRAPFQFSQEVTQEFQVNTNSYSAELGHAGGGVINVVTKSGTNEFHGTGFWYYRDRSMNATDLVNKLNGEPKSPYHFHQFGGTLGGPLVRKKLFFFVNYDGQRSTAPNLVVLNLPAGFRLSFDPQIAGFQQRALDYLIPRAASWIRTFNQNVYFAKINWQIAPRHLLSGRWNRQRFTGDRLENVGPQVAWEHTGASVVNTDALAFSLTSTNSSSTANVGRFSYVRDSEPGLADGINPEANIFEGGQLVLSVGRFTLDPREITIRRSQWSDTLSFIHGSHGFKLGVDVLFDRIKLFTAQNFSGSYRFNSLESFGRSLAGARPASSIDVRYVQSFSRDLTPGVTVHPDFVEFAGFVQDEWRVQPHLTLNLGVRYDLQSFAKPSVRNPSAALATAGIDTGFIHTDKKNFAPRLGFAWTPLRNNRLAVRGGYGIFFARTPAVAVTRPHFNNGVSVQTRTFESSKPSGALIPSYPNTLCGAPDLSGAPPSCAAPAVGASDPIIMLFSPNYRQPYTQQGSFGIEGQLQKDLALSVSYLWVKGTHLQRTRDINLGTPTTPATISIAGTNTVLTYQKFTLPRPIVGFDQIWVYESSANSSYHGLALQLNKRFSQNFQLLASYTLSKVLDDANEPYALTPGIDDSKMPSDSSNPHADRSAGINDQRHRFVLSGIWELNYANHLPQPAKAIFEGWEVSGIFTIQTGQPYSGLVNFDLNNDGNSSNDRTPGLGRNTFYLPSTVSFDPRVTRDVQLTERVKLQFIWEAFNVFNHSNITGVRTTQFSRSTLPAICGIVGTPCLVPQNTGLSAFGTPTATSGPRIMQLSAKFVF